MCFARETVEFFTNGEQRVSYFFCSKASRRKVTEPFVIWILLVCCFRGIRTPLVSITKHDKTMERFYSIVVSDQLAGQEFEQFRMGRNGTAGSEIIGRCDNALAEVPLPNAICQDACK